MKNIIFLISCKFLEKQTNERKKKQPQTKELWLMLRLHTDGEITVWYPAEFENSETKPPITEFFDLHVIEWNKDLIPYKRAKWTQLISETEEFKNNQGCSYSLWVLLS